MLAYIVEEFSFQSHIFIYIATIK